MVMAKTHLTDTPCSAFDLDPRLRQALDDLNFHRCTPIQAAALPPALAGEDVAGQAQTGTGKTAAFGLALLQRLLHHSPLTEGRPNQPRALVLAPTRELAVQVHKDLTALAAHTDLRIRVVFGGTGYQSQREQLERGVDVLVGTPGRLIDYFKQRVFDLHAIKVVVLDEADRMFDLGFIKDIRFLLRRMPPPNRRQGMLFSATLSYRVKELAYEHMNNPRAITIEAETVTAQGIRERAYLVANEEKIPLLIGLMRALGPQRGMVFVNTKREAERVWGFLEGNGLPAGLLTGDVPQRKRLRLLQAFQNGELPVLVATDVAARGLHVPNVSHVFNFDLPEDPEDYVHRVGRTARAGASGDAVSFVCETHAFCLPAIEAFVGHKLPIEPLSEDLLADVDPKSRVRLPKKKHDAGHGRRRGHGRSHKGHRGDGPKARKKSHS